MPRVAQIHLLWRNIGKHPAKNGKGSHPFLFSTYKLVDRQRNICSSLRLCHGLSSELCGTEQEPSGGKGCACWSIKMKENYFLTTRQRSYTSNRVNIEMEEPYAQRGRRSLRHDECAQKGNCIGGGSIPSELRDEHSLHDIGGGRLYIAQFAEEASSHDKDQNCYQEFQLPYLQMCNKSRKAWNSHTWSLPCQNNARYA